MTSVDDRSIFALMKKKDTRADIVSVGTEIIAINGFNATGIDMVLKQIGVPKGSFYHYFKSKEDFGLAVIDSFADGYDRKLSSFLDAEQVAPKNRIRNYLEHGVVSLTQNQFAKGCLIGNLGQELADQNERFRVRLDEIFSSWKERFASCLREGQQLGEIAQDADPTVLAGFILSGWEGAILRAKVMKSAQPLRDFIDTLFATVLRS